MEQAVEETVLLLPELPILEVEEEVEVEIMQQINLQVQVDQVSLSLLIQPHKYLKSCR